MRCGFNAMTTYNEGDRYFLCRYLGRGKMNCLQLKVKINNKTKGEMHFKCFAYVKEVTFRYFIKIFVVLLILRKTQIY